MQSLKEALEASGLAELARKQIAEEVTQKRQEIEATRKKMADERRIRSATIQPHQRWWQNFRFTATAFEIKMFVKVQCEQWQEGLDFIAARNLNKVTTRCKTREEAIEQVRVKIEAWQKENILKEGIEPPAGALLYWRIYG